MRRGVPLLLAAIAGAAISLPSARGDRPARRDSRDTRRDTHPGDATRDEPPQTHRRDATRDEPRQALAQRMPRDEPAATRPGQAQLQHAPRDEPSEALRPEALASGRRRQRLFRTRHGGPALHVLARARTDLLPKSVTISPDGNRVVVCNFGRADHDNVWVYDASSLARVGVIDFAGNAVEAAFSHDGTTLFVSNFRRHVVEVIDFESGSVVAEIRVGLHPKFLAVSPDDRTLYVANYFDRTVSVIDVATRTELRRLPTERHPRGMVVRPDGTLLVAAFHGDVVHVFPEGAERERERFESCELPRHLLLSPDGATMYLTCSMGHVGFYDASTGARLGMGSTGRNPRSIAISGNGRWIAVANFSSRDVSLIDAVDRTHRTYPIEGAGGIVGIAMHPGASPRIYATSWDTAELLLLGERTPLVSASASALGHGSGPASL